MMCMCDLPQLAVYFLEKALEVYYGKSDHQAQWNTGPYVRTMEDNHLNIGSTYNQMGLAYKVRYTSPCLLLSKPCRELVLY